MGERRHPQKRATHSNLANHITHQREWLIWVPRNKQKGGDLLDSDGGKRQVFHTSSFLRSFIFTARREYDMDQQDRSSVRPKSAKPIPRLGTTTNQLLWFSFVSFDEWQKIAVILIYVRFEHGSVVWEITPRFMEIAAVSICALHWRQGKVLRGIGLPGKW